MYQYQGRAIKGNGVFLDTFKTHDLCDSIVEFRSTLIIDVMVDLKLKMFEGEVIKIGDHRFTTPTQEQITVASHLGCDSIINLDLQYFEVFIPNAFSPNKDGINDHFTIFGGNDLVAIKSLSLFNRWGRENI